MAEPDRLADDVAMRFRRDADWFIARRSGRLHTAVIGAVSERVVDLLPALAFHLDPAVDLFIDSLRDRKSWSGHDLALPDVREVVGRLRLPLAMNGGVEITLVTADDQLSLTPELQLVVYSRTDRWLFLLEGLGLVERSAPPARVWSPSRRNLRPVTDLTIALQNAAERLGLADSPFVTS